MQENELWAGATRYILKNNILYITPFDKSTDKEAGIILLEYRFYLRRRFLYGKGCRK